MGSVRFNRQRQAWFIDYVDATGRRMRQTIGAGDENKRLAKRVLSQREAETQLGIHRLPSAKSKRFDEFSEDWLQRTAGRRLAPKTLESYEDMVQHHLLPVFGGTRLGSLTRRDVEIYLARKALERRRVKARDTNGRIRCDGDGRPVWIEVPFASKTINYALMVLKAILNDAVQLGVLHENPAARVKPLSRPNHEDTLHFLEPDQIARLLDVTEDPRWRTLYVLAIHTGLRRGELLGLRWRDIDTRRGILHVRRQLLRVRDDGNHYTVLESPLKSRYSRRTLDLSPTALDALRAVPAGDNSEQDFIFRSQGGGPIDPDNVDRAFKRHLQLAGLPEIRFHDLRHTHASLLIAAGHPSEGYSGTAGPRVDHDNAEHVRASHAVCFSGVGPASGGAASPSAAPPDGRGGSS